MKAPQADSFELNETIARLREKGAARTHLRDIRWEVSETGRALEGVRDNLAFLTTAVKEATAQAKQSAESSSALAKNLNRVPSCWLWLEFFKCWLS
jgi:hypothetical protein